ncbi:MAG: hypothetical protein ACRCUY_11340 [Thermoguttaceae bacterium]
MLLEEMIHSFWRDSTLLSSAVPLERFFTGQVNIGIFPSVLLVHEKTNVIQYSSRTIPIQKMIWHFEIWHEFYEEGADIARLVERLFHRLQLNDPQHEWSYLFHYIQSEQKQSSENKWQFIKRFELIG